MTTPVPLASCLSGDVVHLGLIRVRVAFTIGDTVFVRAERDGGGFGDLASFPGETPVVVDSHVADRVATKDTGAVADPLSRGTVTDEPLWRKP